MDILTTRESLASYVVLTYSDNLDAGKSYVSDSFKIGGKKEIRVYAYNEGASGISLKVEISMDSVTWYELPISSGNDSGSSSVYGVWEAVGKYARIIETNSDSSNAQTSNMLIVNIA